MKKIILLLIFTLSPIRYAHAIVVVPHAEIDIIKNTVIDDGVFDFTIYDGSSAPIGQFQIQTSNHTGKYHLVLQPVFQNSFFRIVEDQQNEWKLSSIDCSSASSNNNFYPDTTGIDLNLNSFTSSTCVFTNTKIQQKNPILIIPGVLGTEMFNSSEKLWPDGLRMLIDVGDEFMDKLAFNNKLESIDPNVSNKDVIGRELTFDYSQGLLNELAAQNYIENQQVFTFPYDWRYGATGVIHSQGGDITNIDLLKRRIDEVRNITGSDKVDVVAHSTGGLIVKKYVMDNPTDHHIGKAVFVGVPNTGAPKALKVLLTGDNFGVIGLSDQEMEKIAQNMPVVYDLMPSLKYYSTKGSYYQIIDSPVIGFSTMQDLSYDEAKNFLLNNHGANNLAITGSEALHTQDFDEYDMRSAGVDLYNIVGCRAGTIGKIKEQQIHSLFGGITTVYNQPEEVKGDGTVPLESATNLPIDADKRFFALAAQHGKMPSQDGIRQKIVNILTGSTLGTQGITNDIANCKLNGKSVAIYSPVDVEVFDQNNNRLGLAPDGSIQNDIPNADLTIMGEHKFLFLPQDQGQIYHINLQGTGQGAFTLKTQDITNDIYGKSENFIDIPVTTSLLGTLELNSASSSLALDNNGDGTIDQTIIPTTLLDENQSKDLISPSTTVKILGEPGKNGFYRSNISVVFTATDPTIPGYESEISGVLKTQYQVDGGEYQQCVNDCAVSLKTEGRHVVSFFSTDKAGNKETVNTLELTIDKTSPELNANFDLSKRDFVFQAQDDIDPNPLVSCTSTTCTLTDKAGNTRIFTLEKKYQVYSDAPKSQYMLKLKSTKENNRDLQKFLDNIFLITLVNSKQGLVDFNQTMSVKGQEIGRVEYNKQKDISIIKDMSKPDGSNRYSLQGTHNIVLKTNINNLKINIE